jgi:hypothetical protein
VKLNVPGPVTDAPLVAEIHEASERAVQLHWLLVEMVIDPAPPAAAMVTEVAERLKVHETGVGFAGPESQPESATLHTTSSARKRMADSLSMIRLSARQRGWYEGRLRANWYTFGTRCARAVNTITATRTR